MNPRATGAVAAAAAVSALLTACSGSAGTPEARAALSPNATATATDEPT